MPNLLLAGVSPQWLATAADKGYDLGPRNDGPRIGEEAKQMMTDLQSLPKVTFKPFMFDPDDEANRNKFVELLKSEQWDGISLGGGVRTIPQLSEYFTDLVNMVVAEHPNAKLVFPLTPKDIVPAFKKLLPSIQ